MAGMTAWCSSEPATSSRRSMGRDEDPRGYSEQEAGNVIGFIVVGLVVGIVARVVVPGRQHLSLGMTLLLGLIGSVLGGVIANAIGTGDIFELNIIGSIMAIAAAVLLIIAGDRLGVLARRSRD
jgi:uncharacterized membrane protein YeaQ/YmgE (transglycosylase-associated protein family)